MVQNPFKNPPTSRIKLQDKLEQIEQVLNLFIRKPSNKSMRAVLPFLTVLLLSGLAVAAYSTNQETAIDFPFHAENASSVFVKIAPGWTGPKASSDFLCPADWFRDADFSNAIHCACAAPCRSFLNNGNLTLFTTTPSKEGNYACNVLAYSESGKIILNESQNVTVQTPARLDLRLIGINTLLVDVGLPLSGSLSNVGQGNAQQVRLLFRVLDPEGRDVTSEFSAKFPENLTLTGGSNTTV